MSDTTAQTPRWHMPDATTLVIERGTCDGARTSTYSWPDPPQSDSILRTLGIPSRGSDGATGQRSDTLRRRLLGRWRLSAHRATGPPRWNLPRVFLERGPGRFELGAGWLLRCYTIVLRHDLPGGLGTTTSERVMTPDQVTTARELRAAIARNPAGAPV